MASDQKYVDYIIDQIHHPAGISYKKMFGEYGLYAGARIFALVCDNRLLIKPTEAGKAFIGSPKLDSPFPGAKSYYLIDEELEDHQWLSNLVKVTVNELPDPKPKKPKKAKKQPMKHSLTLLACILLLATSCKKGSKEPEIRDPAPEPVPYKYAKIQSYYTPIVDGQAIASKRYLFTEIVYDSRGNIIQQSKRSYPNSVDSTDNPKQTSTYTYENNKRVEEISGNDRFVCTYNNTGDTLELKYYDKRNNVLKQRSLYEYGSNGKKSSFINYAGTPEQPGVKYTFAYNDLNQMIRNQIIGQGGVVLSSYVYSYNSRGHVVKIESDEPGVNSGATFTYVYNDKGWITEYQITPKIVYNFSNYINTYDTEGLLIKQRFTFGLDAGIIDYVYIKR